MIRNAIRYCLVLGAICLISGGGIALTYNVTKGKIAAKKAAKIQEAVKKVLPDADEIKEEKTDDYVVYVGKDKQGKTTGWAVKGGAKGYSSTVEVMVGVKKKNGTLAIEKATIVAQAETPGLGTKAAERKPVLKSDPDKRYMLMDALTGKKSAPGKGFMDQYTGLTGKDFIRQGNVTQLLDSEGKVDVMTGATITTNAVNLAVKQALERIRKFLHEKN